ncbi:MAG: hypothetical protein IT240_01915 [Bacteroidia bacterium]|jgi:hypothetical protein|nr:hypothetical protein [Bacteroidia bacterium]MCC6767775.1 hypothetical protein [Bacteroidia bacterium]
MLKKRVQYLLLVLALTLIGTSDIAAQNEDESPSRATEQIHLPFTIRFDGGLGFLNKPKAMKDNFYSTGDVGLGAVLGLGAGFNLGLTGRYTAFQVSRNASNFNDPLVIGGKVVGTKPVATNYTLWSPGVILSYDRFVTPYSMFSFSVNAAYAFVRYSNLRDISGDTAAIQKYSQYTAASYNHKALTMQPSIGFHYFFEEHIAMSIKVGFTRTWSYFEPEKVRLDGGAISYESADLNGPVQFFNVGLGFIYTFKRIE